MKHQEIIDRLAAMDREQEQLRKQRQTAADAERQKLRAICGGIGHLFASNADMMKIIKGDGRSCVICGEREP